MLKPVWAVYLQQKHTSSITDTLHYQCTTIRFEWTAGHTNMFIFNLWRELHRRHTYWKSALYYLP